MKMNKRYDKDSDAMYIYLEEGDYEVSEEIGEGIVLDISKEGKIIGIEILDFSEKISKNIFNNIVLEK